jgi:hypothetical protein
MWLHVNMMKAKCLRWSDYGAEAEFYWVYQLYIPNGSGLHVLHQGFSEGCPIDDGYSFRTNDRRQLNDPRFTVKLPELPDDGPEQRVVLDLSCWEADNATATTSVKALYTNEAAARLWQIYHANNQRVNKTIDDMMDWLDSDGMSVATTVLAAAGAATGGVATGVAAAIKIAPKLVDLVRRLAYLLRDQSDDYMGLRRFELFYAKRKGTYVYRWLMDNGIESTIENQQLPYYRDDVVFEEADRSNKIACKLMFQPIYELAQVP